MTANLGCFEWQREDFPEAWKAVPKTKVLGVTVRPQDGPDAIDTACSSYFMDLQQRDVHKTSGRGASGWTLNDKPKMRAEVQLRTLSADDKLDFMKAMQGELRSYLEHEAVAIARRHNVSPERVMGMRWALSWRKAVTNETGETVSQKPKARLIIKGLQDPDLLCLKRDSPTLATQNCNMPLALTATNNNWDAYVGDTKTAFLNGDATETDREIYSESPEEVRRMLNMKPNEFRILKAVYGLLHAPRAWADKLGKELEQHGWIQSRREPSVWRLYDDEVRTHGHACW